jgi:Flp pilus assembly protein TadG
MTRDPRPRERGSMTLELAVLAPALLLLVGLLIVGGRVAIATGSVEAAARDAARTASIARTPTQARTHAMATATTTLAAQALQCSTTTVDVTTAAFAVAVGQPAQVGATVTCQVALADLALPGLPGTRTVTGSATSPLDTYRER